MPTLPNLRIGLSGFPHPDWKGLVYPQEAAIRRHALETLARFVDVVELDRLPRSETAQVWLHSIRDNPRFQFSALLPRRFTYQRDLAEPAIASFKQGLWPLHKAGRLGAVVLEFPWAFRYNQENREFLIRVRRAFHEFPLVAEFRHETWSFDEALGTLIDYRIGLVNLDQPAYFRAMPPTAFLTSSVAYVRLHGRLGRASFQEYEAPAPPPYLYTRGELEEWRPRIERLANHANRTFVVAVNSAGARSAVNALQLHSILTGTQREAPPDLLAAFYRELAGFRSRRPVQPRLIETAA
jgi:uncharacterized protein YecE (DUF72 family)